MLLASMQEKPFPSVRYVLMPPSDITVHLVSDTPSWLTPAIAAGAAILAAFLTWLGARINDEVKLKREKHERWDSFIVEEAAKFQRDCEIYHKFRLNGNSPDAAEDLYIEVTAGYNQLLIVSTKEVAQATMRLYALVIQHSAWDYDKHRIMPNHNACRNQLNDAIRSAVGIRAIDWNPLTADELLEQASPKGKIDTVSH